MLSKTYIVSFLLAAATSVAARPDVQLFNNKDCPTGSEGSTFGPIPTDRCQTIAGNAQGAKVRGPVAAGCTYRFFADSNCGSVNFIDITSTSLPPNTCFHVIDNQPVGSVQLRGDCSA